jgi:hypothetical protein
MNPENPFPKPEPFSDSGCGVPPQSVQGASRSESADPNFPLITAHGSLGTSFPVADEFRIGLELARLEQTYAEPDYDDGFDNAREHELLMHDLADDNDDFARSDEEGWYYSDED